MKQAFWWATAAMGSLIAAIEVGRDSIFYDVLIVTPVAILVLGALFWWASWSAGRDRY